MGLDMYLYLSSKENNGAVYRTDEEYDALSEEEKPQETQKIYVGDSPVTSKPWHKPDVWQVAYWRKSNQIHSWFVQECQGGEDDCREQVVPREKIVELRDLCREVLRTRNHELLSPTAGFFFGSTDIGEWYWRDLEETVVMLNRALDVAPGVSFFSSPEEFKDAKDKYDFVYSSSW